jgi:hypothetical protein
MEASLMTRISAALVVALLFVCSVAEATQVEYRTPRQLGDESSLVVQGTVQSTRAYWNATHTKILTEARIDVASAHKGADPGVVSVLQLGGVIDNVRMSVAGALSWRVGEEVLLFLEPMRDGSHRVSGFSQGKFRVERDVETGNPFVHAPTMDGVELLGAPSADGSIPQATITRMTVDKFINQALGRR